MKGGVCLSELILSKYNHEVNEDKEKAAVELAKEGYHLLPLMPAGKEPYFDLLPGKSTDVFRKNRATPATVKSWLKHEPEINIGLFMGVDIEPKYKLIAIDFDTEPSIGLPITPISKTLRGMHVLFKCRADDIPGAHKTNRGEIITNKYIVAPPSIHPYGKKYEWYPCLNFLEVNLSEFEPWREKIISELEQGTTEPQNNSQAGQKAEIEHRAEHIGKATGKRIKPLETALTPYKDKDKNLRQLKQISKNADAIIGLFNRLFGVNISRLGQTFLCPLHPENNPSTALYRTDNKVIGVKDFHRAENYYTLPEFYFEYWTGESRDLKGAYALIWFLRMLKHGRLLRVPAITPPKDTKHLSEAEKRLYEGFIELLEVQQAYCPSQTSAPFSHRFAVKWTGLSRYKVEKAKAGLAKKGYLEKVEAGEPGVLKAGKWALNDFN